MKTHGNKVRVLFHATVTAIFIAGTTYLFISQPAAATPVFAKQTGKSCGDCHQSPSGGGALTPLGETFKANGNKLPK
jgi:hypothetical protein